MLSKQQAELSDSGTYGCSSSDDVSSDVVTVSVTDEAGEWRLHVRRVL
jgi:hypothetical protein